MKNIASIVVVLMCALLIAGCGANGGVVVDPNAQAANTSGAILQPASGASSVPQSSNLFFESNGVKIRPYDLADGVLSSLGEPSKTFEAPSCAYQGVDKFYTYGGFELMVNSIDGAEHVSTITIKDDTVSLPQGVKIGDAQDAMIQKMGSNYQECGGIYNFIEGTTTLQIGIKDGKVAQILYMYTPVTNGAQVCPTNAN